MASNRRPWASRSVSTLVLADILVWAFRSTEPHPKYIFNLVTRSLICIVSTLSRKPHKIQNKSVLNILAEPNKLRGKNKSSFPKISHITLHKSQDKL